MNITKEEIDSLNAVLNLKVTKDDFMPTVDKTLQEYRKTAEMKGFRKGMVPMGMIKKMVGNQILADEINKTMYNEVYKYIQDNKIDILGNPLPKDGQRLNLDINEIDDFEFKYELGIQPEVQVKILDKSPKFDHYKIKVDDKTLNEEIGKLQKRFGEVSNPESVEEEDILNVEFKQLDKDDNPFEEGLENGTSIPWDIIKDKKLKSSLTGMKIDEHTDINPYKVFDREDEAISKHILNVSEDLAPKKSKFRMTIKSISRVKPAEINQELFDKVFGENHVKSETEFRDHIASDLEKMYATYTDRKLNNDITERLLEKTDIPLPEDFLKRWIRLSNEKPISEEDVEKDFPQFIKNLKWSLIINTISKGNNLKVEESEIVEKTKENLLNQLYQYGMHNVTEEQLGEFVNRQLEDKEYVNRVNEAILEEKIFDHVKTLVKLKEKEISMDDFLKLK